MTSLALTGITPMVQDWGGPIGLSVAVRQPQRVRALVIGNTWGWPVRGNRRFEWFSKLLGSEVPGSFLVKRADVFTRVFVPGGVRRRRLSRRERAMYHLPALIVWGDRDAGFRQPERRRLERTFPNNRMVVLQGAGDFIQEDAPTQLSAAIRDWWPGEGREG